MLLISCLYERTQVLLGEGGHGSVYKGSLPGYTGEYAIKQLLLKDEHSQHELIAVRDDQNSVTERRASCQSVPV